MEPHSMIGKTADFKTCGSISKVRISGQIIYSLLIAHIIGGYGLRCDT